MLKRLVLVAIIIVTIIAAAVFLYRYQIFQYSAESMIRKLLPPYVKIDTINFDLKNSRVVLNGFKISNPDGFSEKFLLEITGITCGYRMRGKSIIDGIEILEPSLEHLVLNIERDASGKTNLGAMGKYIETTQAKTASEKGTTDNPALLNMAGNRKLSDILKLPETFSIKDGKIIFVDRAGESGPHILTFENIEAKIGLKLNSSYSGIFYLTSRGKGDVNGAKGEVVNWEVKLDPTRQKLTMSSNFDVSNVNMIPLQPYYDKYSPLVFNTGKFSGTLIFDFNNDNIGSTNEIHLSGIKFSVKPGYENATFWETTVPDLVKYFTSSYGDIVFDFKIKGDMSNPKFYLGPISKQALVSMAVDKISAALGNKSGTESPSGGPKSDIDKAKEYIGLFKNMVNKK